MVVEFYSRKYPDLPNPPMGAIKRVMGYTEDDGTPLDGVTRVNRILMGNQHQLEFEWIELSDFREIKQEIDNQRPVIAWLKRDKFDEYSHSVVIKGRTDDDLMLKVNDPDPSAQKGDWQTSEFMRRWTNSDRILIRAKVTERPQQRELMDFA